MVIRYFLSLLLALSLTSCTKDTQYQQILDNWQGATTQQLTSAWGTPDTTTALPNGNTLYTYTFDELTRALTIPTPSYTTVTPEGTIVPTPTATTGGETFRLSCTTSFDVSPQGRVVGNQFNGNHCVDTHR